MNRFKSMDRIQLPQVHTNVSPWYFAEFGQDSRPIRGRLVRWVRHLPTPSLTQNNAFPVMMHPDCESYVGTSLHPQSESLPRTHLLTHAKEIPPTHTHIHTLTGNWTARPRAKFLCSEVHNADNCKGLLYRNPVLAAHAVVYRLQTQRNLVDKRVLIAECKRRPEACALKLEVSRSRLRPQYWETDANATEAYAFCVPRRIHIQKRVSKWSGDGL